MTENFNGEGMEETARQGGAALKHGMKAARGGLNSAHEHLDDGPDMVRGLAGSLNEFVTRQPLVAVAGAFLIAIPVRRAVR